tara:strand:+ start:75 stop:740 length:666 start_codon:yes stop_codon:yes gene_type:complete
MSKVNNKINQLAKEVSDLNFKIKFDTIRLNKIKEQLIDLMVNENVPDITTDKSDIKKSKWSIRFSTQLRKEFHKLDDKKKEELLNKGLLKIQYRLNTKNFEELKSKQEKTELDEYIIDKKNQIFLRITLNENSKKILVNEIEAKDDNYDERIDLEESFLEEIESFADEQDYIDIELMEEAKPDPQYFSDDDPVDMSDVDKIEKGFEEEEYSEEDDEEDYKK